MTNKENIKQYFVNEDENFSVYFEKDLDNHNYNIIICYEDYEEKEVHKGEVEITKTYKIEIQFKIISNALEAFHKLSTWSIKGKLPFSQRVYLIEDMKQTEIDLLNIVEEMKREDNLL